MRRGLIFSASLVLALQFAKLMACAGEISKTPAAPVSAPKLVEELVLVGTGSAGKNAFAFFDGSAGFRGLTRIGEKVAGCTLVSVKPESVTLRSTEGLIELPLKMELRRTDGGPWSLTAAPRPSAPIEPLAAATPTSGGTSLAAGQNREADDFAGQTGFDKKSLKFEKAIIEAMKPGKEFKPSKGDEGDKIKKLEKFMGR